MAKMKAAIFVEPGRIVLDEKPVPEVGPLDALLRVTTTTICGTDIHILKGEYPVRKGLTIGHEPVGIIEKLGSAVAGYEEGQRVVAGAITPSGHSHASLAGCHAQDGVGTPHGWKPIGGWKFGNTIDGCQAEYVLVPDAMANLAPVPDGLMDEQVLMCPDIMSTGFSGAESGQVRIGDIVAIFAQGPIGLCATAGCRAQKLHPYPAGPPCRKPSSIRRLWPLNTFAENSRLYSPAMTRLTPLTMVETGLPSFSNCLFRAMRRIPPAYCRRIIRLKRISP